MIAEKQLSEMITRHLEGTTLFPVDVLIRSGNRIHVFIDGDKGVTVDDCRDLSRYIESQLDRETEDYDLTVSTAGADSPLRFPRQYPKHIGREVEIRTEEGALITGTLVRADENGIELEHQVRSKKEQIKENTILKYDQVKEAKIKLSFK
jgi:ribosome maturation factor RimP